MGQIEVGKITHYFGKIGVAGVKLVDILKVGDTVRILGHTTDLTQPVTSMQIGHEAVDAAGDDTEIGLKVDGAVREHDTVYKLAD